MNSPNNKTARSKRDDVAERTRRDILKVATNEFAEKGLSGARVDEIAEKTQTSKRMIYYYFGGKEGLYREVLDECYSRIRQLETRIDLENTSPDEALAGICGFTFDYHVQNPEFVRIVMNENILHGEHIGTLESIKERNKVIISNLSLLLERGAQTGMFRPNIDPIDLHMSISALCFHVVANKFTFSKIFDHDMSDPDILMRRRAVIIETILSWVKTPVTS